MKMQRETVTLYLGSHLRIMYRSVLPQRLNDRCHAH